MTIEQNVKKFQESITQELIITKDRVRDLIATANWGKEGSYKEAILIKTIKSFLPLNLNIGTGFILGNSDNIYGTDSNISTQLDIIIYDNKIPVIFKEGDFVILTDTPVRAVIEVKTRADNYSANIKKKNALNNIINTLDQLNKFSSFRAQNQRNRNKFVGIFSYEYNDSRFTDDTINCALRESKGIVNHISLGPNKFIRFWKNTENLFPRPRISENCYIKYNIENLSFSYFISNLLHLIADEDPDERDWFSFPIEGTKERYRVEDPIAINH